MKKLRLIISIATLVTVTLPAIASTIRGDLNGDGKLSMEDVATLSDILIGKSQTSLSISQLDFNADGAVNIGDITKLIDIIANSSEGGLDVGIDGWDDSGEDLGGTLSAPRKTNSDVTLSTCVSLLLTGNHAAMPIAVTNNVAVNAFLMTIKLPEGISLEEINFEYCTLMRNTPTHKLDTNITEDGDLKVIAYATDNSAFTGNEGDIVSINVEATDNKEFTLGASDAQFSNAEFATLYADELQPTATTIIRTVSYYVDDALYQTQTYEYGALITPLEAPQKEGYTFSGWSDIPTYMPEYDISVYGSFVSGVDSMSISKKYDVYTTNGQLLHRQAETITDLPPGIYIINSKKIKIK